MFIRIDDTNYFVITDGKSTQDIYREIFSRMNTNKISAKKRREIIHQIKNQIKK